MKRIILIALFALSISSLLGQDLIVTNKGDSINCKIEKSDNTNIYFSFYNTNDEEIRTFLKLTEVKTYQINYFPTRYTSRPKHKEDFTRVRLSLTGGYSYRTAPYPPNINITERNYLKGLKSGSNFGADLALFFSPNSGIGFKYNSSNASSVYDGTITLQNYDGSTISGKKSEDITISYIGPYYTAQLITPDLKHALYYNLGLGYMGYKDMLVYIDNFNMTGSTVGFNIDFGYDFKIAESIYLGFQVAYYAGVLTEVTLSNGTNTETIQLNQDEYEGLHRLDLNVGLRFYVK